MKIQRKLLTDEQKKAICKSIAEYHCNSCPLSKEYKETREIYCYAEMKDLQEFINDYWNGEIEVDL